MSFTGEVGKPEARQRTGEDGVGCESPDKRAETTTPEIVAGDPTKVVLLFFLFPLLFLFFVSFLFFLLTQHRVQPVNLSFNRRAKLNGLSWRRRGRNRPTTPDSCGHTGD